MDRILLPELLLASTLIMVSFSVVEVQSDTRIDEDYYLNDIDAAVKEAHRSQRNHQFDYANKYWYNRTTARSFELPKLDIDDMDDTRLEGALSATASGGEIGDTNIVDPDLPADEQAEMVKADQDTFEQDRRVSQAGNPSAEFQDIQATPVTLIIDQLETRFPDGEVMSIKGVYSSGTLISTPRP